MAGSTVVSTPAANGLETNAAIFIGENSASGWDSNNKKQKSIVFVFGAFNTFPANFNVITDHDYIDTPIVDNDVEPGLNTQV